MWYSRLKHYAPKHPLAAGLGIATSVLAAAWFIGGLSAPGPIRVVVRANRETFAKATVAPLTSSAAVQPAAQTSQPLTPEQAMLLQAKFDVANSHILSKDDYTQGASPPPPPAVASVEATAAIPPPAPQPMEVAMQTEEAPAGAAALNTAPEQAARTGYFVHGAPSVQHLPMPSH